VLDPGEDGLLQLVLDLGRTVPAATVEMLCMELEHAAPGVPSREIASHIGDATVRESVRKLISGWEKHHPDEGFKPLSWALRAAASMDQWWREDRRLSLVWTGPSPAGGVFRRTDQALLEVIAAARRELWLVSFAGYNLPAVRDALVAAAEHGVSLHMIIESPEESQGKVTFSALEGLGQRLAEIATVYVWPYGMRPKSEKGDHGALHVKCALADDRYLLVSSANLTEFAMSLNMELGVLVRGGDLPIQVSRHFRWLIEHGYLFAVPPP
jgi:phosphatidylserine/phosphatidylglycerophosphate/cardiolipin synthase-like enzyme